MAHIFFWPRKKPGVLTRDDHRALAGAIGSINLKHLKLRYAGCPGNLVNAYNNQVITTPIYTLQETNRNPTWGSWENHRLKYAL